MNNSSWNPYTLKNCNSGYFVVNGKKYNVILPSVFGTVERNFSSKLATDKQFYYTYNVPDIPAKKIYFSIGSHDKNISLSEGILKFSDISFKSAGIYFDFTNTYDDISVELDLLNSKYNIVAKKMIANDLNNDGDVIISKNFNSFYVKKINKTLIGMQEVNYLL